MQQRVVHHTGMKNQHLGARRVSKQDLIRIQSVATSGDIESGISDLFFWKGYLTTSIAAVTTSFYFIMRHEKGRSPLNPPPPLHPLLF